jgi:hypothetical protein
MNEKMKISEINVQTLLIIWCIGAALAAAALLIPIYSIFLIVGSIGWIDAGITTFLIFNVLKK